MSDTNFWQSDTNFWKVVGGRIITLEYGTKTIAETNILFFIKVILRRNFPFNRNAAEIFRI